MLNEISYLINPHADRNMGVKILTVDDSRAIRLILKKAFKGYNCEIIEATNGKAGLTAAEKKPDLIILDVTMPVMDGITMLKKMKEKEVLRSIPVIMLTSEGGLSILQEIQKIGVSDYIQKPFKAAQIIEKARRFITVEAS